MITVFCNIKHCVKSVQIRSYFWSVFFCIQSEQRKVWTKINYLFGHFSRSESKKISLQERRDFLWKILQVTIYLSGNVNSFQMNSNLLHFGPFLPCYLLYTLQTSENLSWCRKEKLAWNELTSFINKKTYLKYVIEEYIRPKNRF